MLLQSTTATFHPSIGPLLANRNRIARRVRRKAMANSDSSNSAKSSPSGENTFKPHIERNSLNIFCCFGYCCSTSRSKIVVRNDSLAIYAGTQTAEMSFTTCDIGRAVSEDAMGSIMKVIRLDTRNFSTVFMIGQEGFRTAYKGMLKDGILIAMELTEEEPRPDISNLALNNHPNLVRLFGCIKSGNQRITIHEFFHNGTLREYLDGGRLDFYSLSSVAVDVASGVMHLHNSTDLRPIIHGDIKSSNILITENLRGKVKLATHGISLMIKGTAGYLDPEYYKTHQLTEKSDVYSFGVLLVEMISGRRATEQNRKKEYDTARWAMKKFVNGSAITVLDPRFTHDRAAIVASENILQLASQCLAKTGKSRPTMMECGAVLQIIRREYKNTLSSSS